MLKELLQYVVGLSDKANVTVLDINGRKYSTGALNHVKHNAIRPLTVHNLAGAVDYIKSEYDGNGKVLIQVIDPDTVHVLGEHNGDAVRDHFLTVDALLPSITFGQYMDLERFNVMLQSCFVDNDVRAKVLSVVGNVKDEDVRQTSDNGVSQVVTAKTGVAQVGDVTVPNPVYLKPYRTFIEIVQPGSNFVLRMRKGNNGPEAGLFEADGGAWKLNAIIGIKAYLREHLADEIDGGRVFIIG